MLPPGWREAAKEQKAFQRVRYTPDPGSLLRLLLFPCGKRFWAS